MHPTDGVPVAPDYVNVYVASAASTGFVADWPASTATAGSTTPANAGAGIFPPSVVGFGSNVNFMFSNHDNTAGQPSTNIINGLGNEMNPGMRQIPGDSTGFSIFPLSSGYITVSMYRK